MPTRLITTTFHISRGRVQEKHQSSSHKLPVENPQTSDGILGTTNRFWHRNSLHQECTHPQRPSCSLHLHGVSPPSQPSSILQTKKPNRILDFTTHRLSEQTHPSRRRPNDTKSFSSWDSETTLGKTEALHIAANEKQRWLQRRNSLSSQRAIYPQRPPPVWRPSTASSRTLPHSFELSDRSSFTTSSTLSSSAAGSRRYTRAAPTCASIPELPSALKSTEHIPYDSVPALPTAPPPAWCPSLTHAPLSADPVIRALTASYPPPPPPPSYSPPNAPVPSLPRRAQGHTARPSRTSTRTPSRPGTATSTVRPSTTTRTLRRPPSARYPGRQQQYTGWGGQGQGQGKLWSYTAPSNGIGEMRRSMYSVSSYGTSTGGGGGNIRGSGYARM